MQPAKQGSVVKCLRVEYHFALDQKVKTLFGDDGIVTMLGYDEGGKQYFVKTKETGTWFKEAQLQEA